MEAKEHLSEAEVTSNLESEGEDFTLKKRPRKERVIKLPGEVSSDEAEDQIKKTPTSRPKMKNMMPLPPPPPSRSPAPASSPSPMTTPSTPSTPTTTTISGETLSIIHSFT